MTQVMTAAVCCALAYVLKECREAQCLCCGQGRLCFLYGPQEAEDALLGFQWGLEEPTQADIVAFDADKHSMLAAAIAVRNAGRRMAFGMEG
jgi:hypothetical protein